MGNSLTGAGLERTMAEELLYRDGKPTAVYKVVVDASNLWDWYCVYRHNFRDAHPDFLIVGFAWNQLSEDVTANTSRLGADFCHLADIPALFERKLRLTDALSEFLLAKSFHLFARRELIRARIFDVLIPKYRALAQSLNENADAAAVPEVLWINKDRHRLLRRFITEVNGSGSELVLVAMPVTQSYPIDPSLLALANHFHVRLVDMRDSVQDQKKFADVMHLNETGRREFTQKLLVKLSSIVGRTDALQ